MRLIYVLKKWKKRTELNVFNCISGVFDKKKFAKKNLSQKLGDKFTFLIF